jgi:hypothetical protein
MKFHFLFHNAAEIVIEADKCKHYTGHAALTNATIISNTGIAHLHLGQTFKRLNLALNGHMLGMYPEGETDE